MIDDDEVLVGDVIEPGDDTPPDLGSPNWGATPGVEHAGRSRFGRLFDTACLLAIALRDPRTGPGPRRAVAAMLIYLVSPVDLISDVIPILGIADDALIVPLLAAAALKLVPSEVRDSAEDRVASGELRRKVRRWIIAIIAVWVTVVSVSVLIAWRTFSS